MTKKFLSFSLHAALFSSVKVNSLPRCILLSSKWKEVELVWMVTYLAIPLDHRCLSPGMVQILQLPATCLSASSQSSTGRHAAGSGEQGSQTLKLSRQSMQCFTQARFWLHDQTFGISGKTSILILWFHVKT